MKISATQTGFALYKEADVIGLCDVTPTPKGADITALSVLSQWRRKGYGSYLLKEILRRFGGYDREAATVFTAPLPADEGEGLFWQKFGFAPEDGRLVRRRTPDLTAVRFVQDYLAAHLPHPKLCIDATCGNGGDTAFLCRLAGPEGRVLGFDIQPEAITSTRARLKKQGLTAELICDSHANLLQYVRPGTADIVMFNFGWLRPGPTTASSPQQTAASLRWKPPSRRCASAACSAPSSTAGASSARTKSRASSAGCGLSRWKNIPYWCAILPTGPTPRPCPALF